jgi:hypothetical protein
MNTTLNLTAEKTILFPHARTTKKMHCVFGSATDGLEPLG